MGAVCSCPDVDVLEALCLATAVIVQLQHMSMGVAAIATLGLQL